MKAFELQSQQLVGILLQLGFVNSHSYFDYDYVSNELNIYWGVKNGGCVFNLRMLSYGINNICVEDIDGKSITANIAYFQKQLDNKLKREDNHASN